MATDNLAIETGENSTDVSRETEPSQPTDSNEATEAETHEPPEGSENNGAPDSQSDESKADDIDQETLYLELDGKEHALNDIRTGRDGHMMQSDYTKKTTAHAKDVKAFKVESGEIREQLLKSQTDVSELRDQLHALVVEDTEIDWVELKEDNPEKYIELKERADKRKAAIDKIKAERNVPTDDPATLSLERDKFVKSDPAWLDKDGNETEAYKKDVELMGNYAIESGWPVEEFNALSKARYLTTILKAAKYDQLQEKAVAIKEKRAKVPVITKPKAKSNSGERKTNAEIFHSSVK